MRPSTAIEPRGEPKGGASAATPEATHLLPGPAAYRSGDGAEDILIAQVAFALAVETGSHPSATAEARDALRSRAVTALSDFAFRYLHNRIEDIRREAAAEATARVRRPPGFAMLVLANLVALAIAAGAAFIVAHPDLLAGRIGF